MFDRNLETFLTLILPKLLGMTLWSFFVGSVVGAIVGRIIAPVVYRWILQQRHISTNQPTRSLVFPAIYGSFISLMLGMLLYQANPFSLEEGLYSDIYFAFMHLWIVPIFSLTGAIIGTVAAVKLPLVLKKPQVAVIGIVVTYMLSACILYFGLAPSPLEITSSRSIEPFPVIARIARYKELPNLTLGNDGHLLGILTYDNGVAIIDSWNIFDKKHLRRFQIPLNGRNAHEVGITSLGFSDSGKELFTASPSQVEIRSSESNQVRLRLDGGFIAQPMAGGRLVTMSVINPQSRDYQRDPYDLKLWDLNSGKLLHSISAGLVPRYFDNAIIAISPDRQLLAFAHKKNKQVEVWDVVSGKQISSFGNAVVNGGPRALAFSPDGRQLAFSLDQTKPLEIWDWEKKKLVTTLPDIAHAIQLHWTALGIVAQYEGRFDLVNPRSGRVIKSVIVNDPLTSNPLNTPGISTLSKDAKVLAIYNGEGITAWKLDQSVHSLSRP